MTSPQVPDREIQILFARRIQKSSWFKSVNECIYSRTRTFISTDSLSFSRLTIFMATFWHVTQWTPSLTNPARREATKTFDWVKWSIFFTIHTHTALYVTLPEAQRPATLMSRLLSERTSGQFFKQSGALVWRSGGGERYRFLQVRCVYVKCTDRWSQWPQLCQAPRGA